MANFCSNCGMQVQPSWKLCPECGTNLVQTSEDIVNNITSQEESNQLVSYQVTCRNCGKVITKEQQRNNNSLCFECFRRFKRSKRNKGTFLMVVGIISLIYIAMFLLLFYLGFGFVNPGIRALANMINFILVAIPILLIIFGVRKRRKWKFGNL